MCSVPLVRVVRSGLEESVHEGDVARLVQLMSQTDGDIVMNGNRADDADRAWKVWWDALTETEREAWLRDPDGIGRACHAHEPSPDPKRSPCGEPRRARGVDWTAHHHGMTAMIFVRVGTKSRES